MAVAALGQLVTDQRAGGSTADGAHGAAKQHIAHCTAGHGTCADTDLLTAGAMGAAAQCQGAGQCGCQSQGLDRKSTRLNSSHT